MGLLDGKAVVITGSGRGLGRAYARAAAAEGAAVVVNDIDGDEARAVGEELEAAGGRVAVSDHRVDDPDAAAALIARCVESFGRIDGLVNNAGRFEFRPAWEVDPQAMAELVSTNVLGTMYCGVAAIAPMREQGSGTIVNVISGAHLGIAGMSLYGATKGAVASLVYGWALDLASDGIRVNGFSPVGRTRMSDLHPGASGSGTDPERVAPALAYLLSDLAAGLSGQIVRFDGRRLSLLTLPSFQEPFLERDTWDARAVAEAVDATLRAHVQPVGLPPSDLSGVDWVSTGTS